MRQRHHLLRRSPCCFWTTSPAAGTSPSASPRSSAAWPRAAMKRRGAHRRQDGGDAGLLPRGQYDLAGFAVGVVDKAKILDKTTIHPGDVVIALPSSGVHSMAFPSCARSLTSARRPQGPPRGTRRPESRQALLAPTKIYVKPMLALFDAVRVKGCPTSRAAASMEISPAASPTCSVRALRAAPCACCRCST